MKKPKVQQEADLSDGMWINLLRVQPNGAVHLGYVTTQFPSIGVRVERDGTLLDTHIVNDVSCLRQREVLGVPGAALLFVGLTNTGNFGEYTVTPSMTGGSVSTFSALCPIRASHP